MCRIHAPRSRHRATAAIRLPALLAGLLLAGGCAMMPGQVAAPSASASPAAPPDPVAAFAATATPGAQARIATAGGVTPVRLVRGYHAASGRECREVLVGAGTVARTELVCQDEQGGWSLARPLLRGSGTPRQ